jgi:hypothetical protein
MAFSDSIELTAAAEKARWREVLLKLETFEYRQYL